MRMHRLLLAGLIAVAACEGTPRATLSAPQHPSESILPELALVDVLVRNTPLQDDVSVTQSIGKQGGTLEIPEAGIKVIIPKNAIVPPSNRNQVEITITALKGNEVAYQFEPHGLRFQQPIMVHQDIRSTNAYRNIAMQALMQGAYYQSLDQALSLASVTEFRPSVFDITTAKLRFSVDHFSGYLVAVGRR